MYVAKERLEKAGNQEHFFFKSHRSWLPSPRRACVIKSLCTYLNEDPEKLVKAYLDSDIESQSTMEQL
ncbi:hypothetical protein G5714_009904 [Onychostoma macrolepis]|uniref:Uncharacterized protein n=1 Tax=Onychostoma macrolepis TaxID=369639 RepID=A0A7J6CNS9_9TELE|nr:hypothetical protein G5714_009904 [Onychostoma macrolepis]